MPFPLQESFTYRYLSTLFNYALHILHSDFQNLCFYLPKGHLLRSKTYGFID